MKKLLVFTTALLLSFSFSACKKEESATAKAEKQAKDAKEQQELDKIANAEANAGIKDEHKHDDKHHDHDHDGDHKPSIDCPMHKLGVDHDKLKPFEEVKEYIDFLEQPSRLEWQKPDEVVAALGLKGDETLTDIGAGSGYFTFRFLKALPKGKVFVTDVQPEMIRHIHHKAKDAQITNIDYALATNDNPKIDPQSDWVFVCDVIHHVKKRPEWIGNLAKDLKPGAKLAIIEFKEGDLPKGPPEAMKIPKAKILELAKNAGLKLVEEKNILPYQTFLIFTK